MKTMNIHISSMINWRRNSPMAMGMFNSDTMGG